MQYPEPVQKLFDAFDEAGYDLYLVGGAVRDWALGKSAEELDDLDFCTNARPPQTTAVLEAAGFPIYELGTEFGTVGAIVHGPKSQGYPKDCQITTYRSAEFYRRGSRHPVVEFGDTIEQDLQRRDFSINSMALDGRGQLVDPYEGKKDLEAGVLRVIGDPVETLAEDPLRILRVGRFIAKLGFAPTDTLEAAANAQADFILEISRERWLQEMTKLLKGPYVRDALGFLHDVRILGIILPEVASVVAYEAEGGPAKPWSRTLRLLELLPRRRALRWAGLLHAIGKPWTCRAVGDGQTDHRRYPELGQMLFEGIARRFTLDNKTSDEVSFLVGHHRRVGDFRVGPVDEPAQSFGAVEARRFVRAFDPYVEPMLAFTRARIDAEVDVLADHRGGEDRRRQALAGVEALEATIAALADEGRLRPRLPSGLGNDIMRALGLRPSPLLGEIKDWLEAEIIAGRLESDMPAKHYVAYLETTPPDFLERALEDDGD